jgi:hypothetical protein
MNRPGVATRDSRHHRRGRTRCAVALSTVIVLALSGCGVPTSGPPVSDGPPPAGGGSANGGLPPPPGPNEETGTADAFVNDYLQAVAGATGPEAQVAAARAYMTSGAAGAWGKPSANGQVNVLRQITSWSDDRPRTASDGSTVIDVTGTFEIVGEFVVATGVLEPPPAANRVSDAADRRKLTFSVGDSDAGSGRFRLTDRVPPGLYMSEQALQRWFAPHPVYFWDPSHEALIPDIRYVPSVLSGIQQATQVAAWTLGSPSDWINGATQPLLNNASLADPTISVTSGGTYVVNLSTSAHALESAALLAYQLRWSLGTLTIGAGTVPMPVDIEIEGQSQVTSSDNSFREQVPNLAPPRSSVEASAYAIQPTPGGNAASGHVVQVTINSATEAITVGQSRQPPILNSPTKNANVVAAAVNGSASAAALVRASGNAETLWIRRTGNAASDFVQVKGLAGTTMSRPQFVTQPAGAVVVAVDGQLKLVDAQNRVHPIQLPSGISRVSAFSIAPDAHRVAFISGGRLYFSVITVSDPPTMTTAQPIVIGPNLVTATSVAWSSTSQLVVGGEGNGRTGKIAELNVDGSLDPNPFTREYGSAKIVQVAAYSYDPLPPLGFDEVMVQTSLPTGKQAVIAGRTDGKASNLTAPFFQD